MNFYAKQKSFHEFNEFLANKNYKKVPSNWWVLLSDIKGSTQAVLEGKFQDVNMVGAAGIVAVINAVKQQIPFVFGGDGATILVPPEVKDIALDALRKTIHLSKEMYKLDLRVGAIEVKELEDKGVILEVAKYELSENNYIAQFKGGALSIAEEIIKSSDKYLLSEIPQQPNLEGLSCRWQPLKSMNGTIMTLIVKSQENNNVYSKIVHDIEEILEKTMKEASPIKEENLVVKFPPRTLPLEVKALSNKETYWKIFKTILIKNFISYILFKFKLKVKGFDSNIYIKEMILNSDFKKFDDTLRLVIDCSKEEAVKIKELLHNYEEHEFLKFGMHLSDHAILTCFVQSTDKDHMHFIDGSGGGYTLSAKQIKNKTKSLITKAS